MARLNGRNILTVVRTAYLNVDDVYPVGAVYISADSTSPASLFGGTWERIQDTFLLAAGSTYAAGATGGEATHTHDISNLIGCVAMDTGSGTFYLSTYQKNIGVSWNTNRDYRISNAYYNTGSGHSNDAGIEIKGSLGNGNNMPPYLVAYVWKRTA